MSRLDPSVLVKLNRLLIVTAIVVGSGISFLGAKGVLAEVRTTAESILVDRNKTNLRQIRSTMAETDGKRAPSAASFEVVIDFQSMAKEAAQAHGCTINFDTVGDPQPFLSKFSNEANSDWKQVEITMTIVGGTSDVLALLREFQKFPTPYELGDFELSRGATGNDTGVTAKFGVKVLFRA